ncbi:MAG: hypothetical protein U0793_30905 [Gemmataceae bacterium]
MSQVVLDDQTLDRLLRSCRPVTILDSEGNVVGRFIPEIDEADLQPQISEEELERRVREESGKGRPLKDFLAELERRQ